MMNPPNSTTTRTGMPAQITEVRGSITSASF